MEAMVSKPTKHVLPSDDPIVKRQRVEGESKPLKPLASNEPSKPGKTVEKPAEKVEKPAVKSSAEAVPIREPEARRESTVKLGGSKLSQEVSDDKPGESTPEAKVKEDIKIRKQPTSTSFVHKLYAMLEDQALDSIIWWHANKTSFFVAPNEDFTKVLSHYFKHANVASFIRQLNMYGFHKVSDSVNGDIDSDTSSAPLSRKGSASSNCGGSVWEFRHATGTFRQGNIEGLGLIKRRSFRTNTSTSEREGHSVNVMYNEDGTAAGTQQYMPRSNQRLGDSDATQLQLMQQQQTQHYVDLTQKLAELQRSYATVYKQCEVFRDELANNNYDQVVLIDMFKDFVVQVAQPAPAPLKESCMQMLGNLDRFRGNILQRSATRGMTIRNISEPNTFTAYSADPGYQVMPTDSTSAAVIAAAAHAAAVTGSGPAFTASERPVLHDIRYSVSSNRSRNPSVFDPIQPLPGQTAQAGAVQVPPTASQAAAASQAAISTTAGQMPSQIPPGTVLAPGVMVGAPVGFQMRAFSPTGSMVQAPTEEIYTRSSSAASQQYFMQSRNSWQSDPTEKRQPYSMYNPPRSVPPAMGSDVRNHSVHDSRSNSIESTHSGTGRTVYSLLNHATTPTKK